MLYHANYFTFILAFILAFILDFAAEWRRGHGVNSCLSSPSFWSQVSLALPGFGQDPDCQEVNSRKTRRTKTLAKYKSLKHIKTLIHIDSM